MKTLSLLLLTFSVISCEEQTEFNNFKLGDSNVERGPQSCSDIDVGLPVLTQERLCTQLPDCQVLYSDELEYSKCIPIPAKEEPSESETPMPETETPVPETETPMPETETPMPETETPMPETETPMPETEVPGTTEEPPTTSNNCPENKIEFCHITAGGNAHTQCVNINGWSNGIEPQNDRSHIGACTEGDFNLGNINQQESDDDSEGRGNGRGNGRN